MRKTSICKLVVAVKSGRAILSSAKSVCPELLPGPISKICDSTFSTSSNQTKNWQQQRKKERKKTRKEQRAHTVNTESVGEAFLVGGFDELEIIGEDTKSTLHLIYGVVSLAVSASEAGEGESMATLTYYTKDLLLQVRHQTNRIGVVEARPCGGACAQQHDKQRPLCHLTLTLSTFGSQNSALFNRIDSLSIILLVGFEARRWLVHTAMRNDQIILYLFSALFFFLVMIFRFVYVTVFTRETYN